MTASGAVLGDLAGPSSSASGAATFCGTAAPPAGAGVLPDAGALPSVSGEHRRRVRSRSRGRRSRSSSDRTDRRAKKRSRRGSPSPERSSRRREKRYRSSSESSEDERAAASSPRARRAHGGARAGGSTWDYGRPRSYARVDPDQSGTRRRSPGPSGVADDDRSTTFESVDFARDDSFRAVLGLIREFHDMAEPASVPGARCKTSLASAYGLAADSYPAFSLPLSPLLSTLLIDINSDLSKFMEDQVLPCWDRLLRQPHCNLFHQGAHALNLHAWRLSSDTTESRAFREGLLESCQGSSENIPLACTSRDGRSSVVGVVEGALLQSTPLFL